MVDEAVAVERDGDVVWCTLCRPPLNLLEPGIITALGDTFTALAADPAVTAVVLGARGRAFTAGMDVRVLRDLTVPGATSLITALASALDAVHRAPFVVIAAIDGPCLGAGLELALACDLRVASAQARFGLPEVRVGVPSVIHAALLAPLIGPGRAAEMLLTGEAIDADRALAWGLVNRVVAAGAVRAAAQSLIDTLRACGPRALRLQKDLIVRWRSTDLATAIAAGVPAFANAYTGDEPREGAQAFLDKRPPRFGARR